jgi:hypothetical protein
VSAIDAKLNTGELVFAKDLSDQEALRNELQNFQRSVTTAGRSLFEHRANEHDDLVFAIGVALFWTQQQQKYKGSYSYYNAGGYAPGPWMAR